MLTNWLLADALPEFTWAEIQDTIRCYDAGARGLLSPNYWYGNKDIQSVLGQAWDVALWHQLGAANWVE